MSARWINVIKLVEIQFKEIKYVRKKGEIYGRASVKLVECYTCHLGFLITAFSLSLGGHSCSTHKVLPATMLAAHEASNCLTLFPWFMKADIAMSWFKSLECTTNAF